MIRLTSTLQKLQIVLAGAVTTNHLQVMVSYSDKTATGYDGGSQLSTTNNTTQVDICAAPAAAAIRDVDYISVRNRDVVAATATIIFDNNGSDFELFKAELTADDQIVYTHGSGWEVLDAQGRRKIAHTTISQNFAQVVPCQKEDGTYDIIELVAGTSASDLGPLDTLDMDTNGVTTINSAYGWDDLTSDISVRGSGSNDPDWSVFRGGLSAYEFSASVMKEAWLAFHPNHRLADGTDCHLHAHFAPAGTGTGVVRFGFEYSIGQGHGQGAISIFPTTTTIYVEFNIATPRQYEHLIAETVAITDANFVIDALALVRIFRDAGHANDTFTGTVHIFTCDIHFRVGQFSTKNKAPDFHI